MQNQDLRETIDLLRDQRRHAVALLTRPPISADDYERWCLATRAIVSRTHGDSSELRQFDFPDVFKGTSNPTTREIANYLSKQIDRLDTIMSQLEKATAGAIEKKHLPLAAKVFLSYAHVDKTQTESLYEALSKSGLSPWMDSKDLLVGEIWASAIQKAVRQSDFFIAVLSRNSVRRRGWIQREIKIALNIWEEKISDDIYLIPVRLEVCEVPDELRSWQWVDLFEKDGLDKLLKSIQVGIERRQE